MNRYIAQGRYEFCGAILRFELRVSQRVSLKKTAGNFEERVAILTESFPSKSSIEHIVLRAGCNSVAAEAMNKGD